MRNLAEHDREDWFVSLDEHGKPYCPVCGESMSISSKRRGNSTYNCFNYQYDENGELLCLLIEGKLAKRSHLLHPDEIPCPTLWDCKYEADPL